jgi:hypothetical protein
MLKNSVRELWTRCAAAGAAADDAGTGPTLRGIKNNKLGERSSIFLNVR